jgi:mRNA interferase RelE/StbE
VSDGDPSQGERRVELAPAAERQLRRLPPGDAARLRGPILALAIEPYPSGVVKLAGTDFWRLRVGDLRIVYLIDDASPLVVVVKVARRSESTYRRVDR